MKHRAALERIQKAFDEATRAMNAFRDAFEALQKVLHEETLAAGKRVIDENL